jgi:hypothetical protein
VPGGETGEDEHAGCCGGQMEMEGGRVEVDRSHERDEAGVEGGEVRDRSEDVAKRDVAAAMSCRYDDDDDLDSFESGA